MEEKDLTMIEEILSDIGNGIKDLSTFRDEKHEFFSGGLKNASYYFIEAYNTLMVEIRTERTYHDEIKNWSNISKKLGHKNVRDLFTEQEYLELSAFVDYKVKNAV